MICHCYHKCNVTTAITTSRKVYFIISTLNVEIVDFYTRYTNQNRDKQIYYSCFKLRIKIDEKNCEVMVYLFKVQVPSIVYVSLHCRLDIQHAHVIVALVLSFSNVSPLSFGLTTSFREHRIGFHRLNDCLMKDGRNAFYGQSTIGKLFIVQLTCCY